MAQTIAAQRGSTTVTCDGQTSVTLFTQSTGTATRVILNSVSWSTPNGTNYPRCSLMININGTGNETCVALLSSTNPSSSGGQTMFPNSTYSPLTGMQSTSNYISRWLPVNQSGSGSNMLGKNLTNGYWTIAGPNGATQASTEGSLEFVPSQFWMNSGDSLRFRCYRGGTTESATIYYSFTTITES